MTLSSIFSWLRYFYTGLLLVAFIYVSIYAIKMSYVSGAERAQAEFALFLYVPFYLVSIAMFIVKVVLFLLGKRIKLEKITKKERFLSFFNIIFPFIATFIGVVLFSI